MPECEKCGRSGKLTLVEIEGARMYVCQDCSRFGKPLKASLEPTPPPHRSTAPMKSTSLKPDALTPRTMELAEDFPSRIQRARERKGWSREELGKKLNERVSVISKLENNEMHPSDDLIKKLERTLDIKLMETVEEVKVSSTAASSGMTLGDFILRK